MDTRVFKSEMFSSRVAMGVLAALVVLMASGSQGARTSESYREEAKQVYASMFHNYNPLVQPNNKLPEPMEVNLNGSILHLRSLNVRKQEMTSLLDLHISWEDSRLAWFVVQVQKVSVNISSIWRPDFVYRNSAAPPQMLSSSHVVVDSSGKVMWHRRDLVTTICRTQPGNDSQECRITLGLNSLTNVDVNFDNETEVSLDPDFLNHEWHVESASMQEEGLNTLHFILRVRPKDGPLPGDEEETASTSACAISYDVNGGHAKMASSRILGAVASVWCLLALVTMMTDASRRL